MNFKNVNKPIVISVTANNGDSARYKTNPRLFNKVSILNSLNGFHE
jgi:hypothetical protein